MSDAARRSGVVLTLEDIRDVAKRVCPRHKVARVDLFGSLSRGEAGPNSDIDLLVDYLPEANAGLFELGALKEDLEEQLGCRVDVVSRRAVEHSHNLLRRQAILENPVRIFAG